LFTELDVGEDLLDETSEAPIIKLVNHIFFPSSEKSGQRHPHRAIPTTPPSTLPSGRGFTQCAEPAPKVTCCHSLAHKGNGPAGHCRETAPPRRPHRG
jgi:hypothetical protein